MWPLTIYEVPISKVEKLERVVSSFAKKWLGLHRCFTNIGLYGRGILEIPVSSLAEEFKCSKVKLEMTLTESRDPCVSGTASTLVTGRKWNPAAASHQAKTDLRHRDIIGNVQQGRGGLGLGDIRPSWQRAAPDQRRRLVVEEVRRHEQATSVYIIELTVPWEAAVEEAFKRKSLKYTELAADAEQRGWKAKVCPVEAGCRGFVGKSTIRLLKELGVQGQTLRRTIKALSGAAEEASRWLWVKRGDSNWAPNIT
ncbi:hypothetical protein DPEC_G00295080 [Dallia pectoralis]|uniref:Uncharacterized protein n=1 Tax=Dallia pectoralis TaxID=75939 RepID=A0ACC2FIN6_DALPE|nr:hypothetical protein DPEC_G00295080 [Dallia pectoralis]